MSELDLLKKKLRKVEAAILGMTRDGSREDLPTAYEKLKLRRDFLRAAVCDAKEKPT